MPLGKGFLSLRVINTDRQFVGSNSVAALLLAGPNSGWPSITKINEIALNPAVASVPLAYVPTVIAKGSELVITGTGLDPLAKVNLFTSAGKKGPFDAKTGSTATRLLVDIPADVPTGPGSLQVLNPPYGTRNSNTVSAPVGATPSITSVTQSRDTITVNGTGFSTTSVIDFVSGEVNRCGLVSGVARCPLTLVSDQQFRVQKPSGAVAGPARIKVLNPPFIPYTTSGTDPDGEFQLQ